MSFLLSPLLKFLRRAGTSAFFYVLANGWQSVAYCFGRLGMKIRVEFLRWDGGEQPKVIHTLSHESHVLPPVQAAVENTIRSTPLPSTPHGYRIVTEGGTELCGWTDGQRA